MLRWRWAGLATVVILAGLFAYLNGGERVTIDFGFATLYRISLVGTGLHRLPARDDGHVRGRDRTRPAGAADAPRPAERAASPPGRSAFASRRARALVVDPRIASGTLALALEPGSVTDAFGPLAFAFALAPEPGSVTDAFGPLALALALALG
jgi:hypothetical protein